MKQVNKVVRPVRYLLASFVIAIGLATLIGSGGGGGLGSSADISYTGPTAAVVFDESNIGAVASAAIGADEMIFDSDIPVISGVNITGDEIQQYKVLEIIEQLTRKVLVNHSSQYTEIAVGVIKTEDCIYGGSVTYNGDYPADSVGDYVTLSFNNCNDLGTVFNGSMTMTISSLSGDYITPTPPWEVGLVITFDQLNGDSGALLIDGAVTATVGENLDSDVYVGIQGSSLFVKAGSEQSLLTNFNMYSSYNIFSDPGIFDSDFTYAGTDIGGSITVVTTTPFAMDYLNNLYPHAGAMTITGNDGANIWITVQDATQVFIQWDITAPFDGPEDNATVLWEELESWTP